jgi:hypothetical protein
VIDTSLSLCNFETTLPSAELPLVGLLSSLLLSDTLSGPIIIKWEI